MIAEYERLQEDSQRRVYWKRWGQYLSERAWGTVGEDYSPYGTAWDYLPHDQARSKAYRWGEDGLAGISDRHQQVCFAPALWNGRDPILKERLFGLTGEEGNHGEDVKEYYYYLDNTPTHSYMKYLYKYAQAEYPYARLVEENRRRGRSSPEYELIDTGIFDDDRYCDVYVEYAKVEAEDILIRITVTNTERLYGIPNASPYVKDSINDYIVHGKQEAVNPAQVGTKAAVHYHLTLAAGETHQVQLRLSQRPPEDLVPFDESFAEIFAQRQKEADDFYVTISPADSSEDARNVQRQAFAGMLWSKQFYYYDVKTWLVGDPTEVPPPPERLTGRNHDWTHLYNADIISMPDKWDDPWYTAWDLAFHCVAFAYIDPDFAKEQLILLLREWYMHPNGQIPAYEWAFSDVNPPVHAWAAYHVYQLEQQQTGKGDREFLEKIFQKLLLNFTWWVNRKDFEGQNVFQGGFLGLDNIGVFDRNVPLPDGSYIEQSDGTSWMGMYCLNMLTIALELARENRAYSDIASKFFEHFVFIAHAMNEGSNVIELWDEQD